MPTLEERVQRLEDESAIKVLKGRYCEFCDNQYDPDGIASLFVVGGVWDGGFMGRFEGREAIREHFRGTSAVMGFAIHHVTNPIIEIYGDTAKGQWYLWQPCTQTRKSGKTSGIWLAARYRETYVRSADAWLFDQMIIDPKMFAPYDGGWVETPFIAGGPRNDD